MMASHGGFIFEMNELFEEDTLDDVRRRVSDALLAAKMLAGSVDFFAEETTQGVLNDVIGTRQF